MDLARRAQRMLGDVNLGARPFDDEQVGIDKLRGSPHVDDRRERRQVDDHVIVRIAKGAEYGFRLPRRKEVARLPVARGADRGEKMQRGHGVPPDRFVERNLSEDRLDQSRLGKRRKPPAEVGIA
jgi:hypothetical protein